MTQTLHRVTRLGTSVALIALLTAVAGAAGILMVLPAVTGGAALTVLSGSMTPHLPVGSVVLVRPVDPGALRVGDVITFQREPGRAEFVTHRIAAVDATRTPIAFTTKGDANRAADLDAVPATAVRGKLWFEVPYLGTLRQLAGNRSLAVLVVILLLVGYAVAQLTGAFRDRRRSAVGVVGGEL